jgi:hypothetical protein
MALLDCSRGMNGKSRVYVAPSATVAQMLEAAEEAVEEGFAEQSEIIMKLRASMAFPLGDVATGGLSEGSGSFTVPLSSTQHPGASFFFLPCFGNAVVWCKPACFEIELESW